MADETLLDADIRRAAMESNLLEPFSPEVLKGASYDIRVGKTAIVVLPEREGGYVKIDVERDGGLEIPVGRSAVIHGLEKVHLPSDMKARMSMRSYFAIKGLLYNGGIIDPGYRGYLFFTVTNMGPSPVHLAYGERFVTTEFVRLGRPAFTVYNDGIEITEIPAEKLPPLPK